MCNKEKFWPILCTLIGRPEWSPDARFSNFEARLKHRDLIETMLDEALSVKTTAEWLATFGGRVPAAPVLDVGQALENPFLAERKAIQDLDHPAAGPFRMLATPIRVAGADFPANPAPELGADTEAVLEQVGYSDLERTELRNAGII
jgi:crotonobetainyl-CoA:carnitine CoA-transferase CaiB-like acyl-CoA transferase